MSRIDWNESFSVNNSEIDEQHKKWITIYNQLSDAFANCKIEEVDQATEDALKAMEDYTRYHFAFEEEYIQQIKYPDAAVHRRLHKDFDNKVFESYRQMKEGKLVLTSQLIKDIRNWLVDHILKEDKKYAQYKSGQ